MGRSNFLKEDFDDESPKHRGIFSAGNADKRLDNRARRNFFAVEVGKLKTNNSPIKIHCFPNEEVKLSNRLKSPYSPLNVVNPSIIPD